MTRVARRDLPQPGRREGFMILTADEEMNLVRPKNARAIIQLLIPAPSRPNDADSANTLVQNRRQEFLGRSFRSTSSSGRRASRPKR